MRGLSILSDRLGDRDFMAPSDDVDRIGKDAHMNTLTRIPLIGLATAFCWGMNAGCADNSSVSVYPVSGRVEVRGEAPVGALIVFHPKAPTVGKDEVPKPLARVKADGSFQATTFREGDGAPAGDYDLTLEWQPLVTVGGETKAGPNVIPAEYTRPESTPIHASVKSGATSIEPIKIDRGVVRTAARKSTGRIAGED